MKYIRVYDKDGLPIVIPETRIVAIYLRRGFNSGVTGVYVHVMDGADYLSAHFEEQADAIEHLNGMMLELNQ